MKQVPLTKGLVALVDDEDYERVMRYKWCATRAHNTWYGMRRIRIDGKRTTQMLHRFILNAPSGVEVDHKDFDGLNCTRRNIRIATHQQNNWNKRKRPNTSSRFIGVVFDRERKHWRAHIYLNGKRVWLGRFRDERQAAQARNAAALTYRGEFARLNDI